MRSKRSRRAHRRQGQGRTTTGLATRLGPGRRRRPREELRCATRRARARTGLAHGDWARAVDRRTRHLDALIAAAGVGKSRLVRELIAHVRDEGGQVLIGRCLNYGEGITYWPVREIVHAAAGITEADDLVGARGRIGELVAGQR